MPASMSVLSVVTSMSATISSRDDDAWVLVVEELAICLRREQRRPQDAELTMARPEDQAAHLLHSEPVRGPVARRFQRAFDGDRWPGRPDAVLPHRVLPTIHARARHVPPDEAWVAELRDVPDDLLESEVVITKSLVQHFNELLSLRIGRQLLFR
jgi:hypothetical protein